MGMKPLKSLGDFSLLFGVELICAAHFLVNVVIISGASSVYPIVLSGVIITPRMQVSVAAWALVGVPLIVMAGTGAIYRVENLVRLYQKYLAVSVGLDLFLGVSLLVSGAVCGIMTDPALRRMGSTFVCGFTDTIFFFYTCVMAVVGIGMVFIVWSMAEHIANQTYPQLLKYRKDLKDLRDEVDEFQAFNKTHTLYASAPGEFSQALWPPPGPPQRRTYGAMGPMTM